MPQKLHRALIYPLVDILHAVLVQKEYAVVVIGAALGSHPKWGSRDRSFVVESTQDMMRNFRYLAWLSGQEYDDTTINLWSVVAAWWVHSGNELPPWEEFEHVDIETINTRLNQTPEEAVKVSVPDWLYAEGQRALGDRWTTELAAMNQPAQVVLRANSYRISRADLQKRLSKQGIETGTIDGLPHALTLVQRRHVLNLEEFKEGLFEVQDASSQLVAPMLDVQRGMTVVDACSGAGGKSLHVADLLQNTGKVYAFDVEAVKLKNLQYRQRRAGYNNIESNEITEEHIKRLTAKADRLLLDVPCTGLGVLKRNPDTKWLLTPEKLEELRQTQRDILSRYQTMLKPGGKLLYVTCSILPQEDSEQVQWFTEQHPDYNLIEEKYVWPSEFGFDGFYMALLEKLG